MHSAVTLDDIDVVVVDDDDDIRFALAQFLDQRGATVFPCSNAGEALEAVRDHHPDIVLSDIGLPGRDGLQLLQDIRSLDAEQDRNIPVIAMTAFGWSVKRTQRLWGAFQAHLDKPFKPDQLLTTIASTLEDQHSQFPGSCE
ncbi:MAG: response regulator [Verrucomicrobia bacterium]|nr:response regulator [Verrucomicrobiota bacterium]MBV8485382.1 response regulator [Verrucomicrobiota bacterium]